MPLEKQNPKILILNTFLIPPRVKSLGPRSEGKRFGVDSDVGLEALFERPGSLIVGCSLKHKYFF